VLEGRIVGLNSSCQSCSAGSEVNGSIGDDIESIENTHVSIESRRVTRETRSVASECQAIPLQPPDPPGAEPGLEIDDEILFPSLPRILEPNDLKYPIFPQPELFPSTATRAQITCVPTAVAKKQIWIRLSLPPRFCTLPYRLPRLRAQALGRLPKMKTETDHCRRSHQRRSRNEINQLYLASNV